MIKLSIRITTILLCVGVFAGFLGRLHPLGDSISLLRLPLGVLCLLFLGFVQPFLWRLALAGAVTTAFATTVPLFFTGAAEGELTLYSKNLWYRNTQLGALAQDMRRSGADVITLQEVSGRNGALLAMLQTDFPYKHVCANNGWNGVAVLSKLPMQATRCSQVRALAAAQVVRDDQMLWVASAHLPWPHPYDHEGALQSALAVLDDLDGPIVMGGDFNIFPWASSVRALTSAAGLDLAGPVRSSFNLLGVPLLLDHAYAPGGGQVTYQPLFGSDHLGILAQLRLTP